MPLQTKRQSQLRSLVNLARYPIDDHPEGSLQTLVKHYKPQLQREGFCCLRNFLLSTATKTLVSEIAQVEALAYYGLTSATPYFNDFDSALPNDHPRNIKTPRELGLLAADQIPDASQLFKLYKSKELLQFLTALLDKEMLYPVADCYQKLSIAVIPEGAGHNWHFDDADFTITLMLRKPANGGKFECVPKLRSPTNENYDGVRTILQGQRDHVKVNIYDMAGRLVSTLVNETLNRSYKLNNGAGLFFDLILKFFLRRVIIFYLLFL